MWKKSKKCLSLWCFACGDVLYVFFRQKVIWSTFVWVLSQKRGFIQAWGSLVGIEVQMSELRCIEELVMKPLASYTHMQWSNVRFEICSKSIAGSCCGCTVDRILWPCAPAAEVQPTNPTRPKQRPRQRTKAALHHHNWPNHLPCKHWIVNKQKWCKHQSFVGATWSQDSIHLGYLFHITCPPIRWIWI